MPFTVEQNITLVGDVGSGKTSILELIKSDFQKKFPYRDISIDPFILMSHMDDDGHLVRILSYIWDTPAFQDWKSLHPFYYNHTDVVLLLFSIDSPESLENASKKWLLEVKTYCRPSVPIVLVGNKIDLRPDIGSIGKEKKKINKFIVSTEEGQALADKIGAYAYIECSVKVVESVREVFKKATEAHMMNKIIRMKMNYNENVEKKTDKCCAIS